MVYAISIMLCILAFLFYRSKLLFCVLIGESWVLFAGAYGHADFFQQKQSYELIEYTTRPTEDPVWWLVKRIFSEIGMSYRGFLWIVSIVALYLIAKTIFIYTKNVTYVWALYFISPMILDVVQYNNFVGMSIVLFSTQYLIKGNVNLKAFLALVTLATGICSYMIVYFFLACVPYLSEMKVLFFSLLGCLVIFSSKTIVFLIASKLMRSDKILVYFNRNIPFDTYLLLSAYILISCLIAVITYHVVIVRRPPQLAELNSVRFSVYSVAEMIVKVNYIMLMSIAIQSFSLEAARMYRNIFVLNYILVSFVRVRKDYELRSAIVRIFTVLMAIAYSYLYIYYWNKSSVLIPVFEENVILKFFFA